jgi:AcrR family transcriptional regulator
VPRGQRAAAPPLGSRAPVGLDPDAIVTAALDLIDENGVSAFTIRRLSEQMGVSAPTIYWHLGSKAGLLEAVVGRVITDMSSATHAEASWDDRLRSFLTTARDQLLAHPGAVELMHSVHSQAIARWSAEALDIMLAAGFDEPTAATYARVALMHAIGEARSEASSVTAEYMERVPGAPGRRYRVKPGVLADDLGPTVALMTTYDLDEQHAVVTELLIDGVRAAVDRFTGPREPSRRQVRRGSVPSRS